MLIFAGWGGCRGGCQGGWVDSDPDLARNNKNNHQTIITIIHGLAPGYRGTDTYIGGYTGSSAGPWPRQIITLQILRHIWAQHLTSVTPRHILLWNICWRFYSDHICLVQYLCSLVQRYQTLLSSNMTENKMTKLQKKDFQQEKINF